MMWAFLLGAVIAEVIGTQFLRASHGLTNWRWIPAVGLSYGVAFTLLAQSLAVGRPVGVAYGIWAALGVALTAVAARVFFGERLTLLMVTGIALICAGALLVETGAAHS